MGESVLVVITLIVVLYLGTNGFFAKKAPTKEQFIKQAKKEDKKEYHQNGNVKKHFYYDSILDCWIQDSFSEAGSLVNKRTMRGKGNFTSDSYVNGVLHRSRDFYDEMPTYETLYNAETGKFIKRSSINTDRY